MKPLTAITVAKARAAADRREIPDPGCRGLYLVVQTSGHKSWALRYRSRGKPVKLTLGTVLGPGAECGTAPALGTPLSLAAARELATKALREAAAGHDLADDRRKQREREHAAQADTFEAVAEEFLRREGPRLRSAAQRRADLTLLYGPLGREPIDGIRRAQFVREFDRIADARGPVRAARVQTATKSLLNWHGGRTDYISVLTRTKSRISIAERARSRVLDDAELRRVWETAGRFGLFGDLVRFLLLTAARRNEAGGLRRSELSPDGTTWTLPAARCKSKRDVVIPLSAAAQEIVAARPQFAGDCVFSVGGVRPFNDFGAAKADFDVACGVSGWVIHDLRRTSRTLMSRAGIRGDVAELCLGHVLAGMRGVYDRHAFLEEKRHAFEALAASIEHIVRPPADTVVPLARRK